MGKTPKKVAKQLNMNDNLAPPPGDIKDMFGSSQSNENDVVKELFSNKGIKTKTDVNDKEISLISRLYFLSNYIENPALSEMLDTLLELKVSRKRMSRKEFIDGLKSMPRAEFSIPGMK